MALPPKVEEPPSKWQYQTEKDEMTSKNIYYALLDSENYHEFDFPYSGQTYGHLNLRKHPRYGKDVLFSIDRGQILCHSFSDCTVTIRFDEKPAIKVQGNEPGDNSSETVFLPYARLFKSIKSSKKMIVEVNVFQEGARAFTFDTKNLKN